MTNERRRQVEAIFDELVDLEPDARERLLRERCGSDDALRKSVAALLAAHAESTRFLEPPVRAAAVSLLSEFSDAGMVGAAVGSYRLTELIASGGMGTVYKAVRSEDAQSAPVAVKLIRHGMDTRDIVRRFHQERATLAELKHPNIATMLDGGVTDRGQPYLVMEFVEGAPIDVHCDEARLGVRERLQLIRTVCTAVQYAHQNLVVHRDLKPGNILVTTDGTPKLVDFGIAKLLDAGNGATAQPITATGFRLITPQYASPEVVRGEPVTTAMDVYSLGLVLYELLTGRRPYDVQHRPPEEVLRLVCDVDPQVPSTAVSQPFNVTAGDGTTRRVTPDHVSQQRRTSVNDLTRLLRGDLDTVVLTALHKDPKRRYASVEQFSQDIGRYLTGFPVHATKDSFVYRTTKLIRRNRVAAVASLIVVASLLIGTAAATFGLVSARREAERARLEAAKASRISAFLQQMFAVVDPEIGSADMKVRDVLEQAATRLDLELGNEPEVLASALSTIGETYHSLGLPQQAEPLLRRALSVYKAMDAVSHAELPAAMTRLGRVLRTSGKLDEAGVLINEAISMYTDRSGRDCDGVARGLSALSGVLIDASDLPGAERALREALAIGRKLHADDNAEVADTMEKLGVTLAKAGRHSEAEPPCRDALAMNLRLFDDEHPRVAQSRRRLAIVLHQRGKFGEAEPLYRKALASDLKLLGGKHPNVSRIKNNLGVLLSGTGRRKEADAMLREALALRRELFGDEHITVVVTLNNLATLQDATGAEPLLRESLQIGRKIFGPDHETVGRTSQNLATCLRTLGAYGAAERYYRDALRVLRMNLGDQHMSVSYALVGLGDVLIELGRPADAEPLLREGLALRRAKLSKSDQLIAAAMSTLGHCLLRLDRLEEASPLLTASAPQLIGAAANPDHERRHVVQRMLDLYERTGDSVRAGTYRLYMPLPKDVAGPAMLGSPLLPSGITPIPYAHPDETE